MKTIKFELAISTATQKFSKSGKMSNKFAQVCYINCDIGERHYFARPLLAEMATFSRVAELLKISEGDMTVFRELWNESAPEITATEIAVETRERAIVSCIRLGKSLEIPVKSFVTSELADSVKSMTKKLNKKADKIRESQNGGRDAYVDNAGNTARDSAGERFDNFDNELESIDSAVADLELLKA